MSDTFSLSKFKLFLLTVSVSLGIFINLLDLSITNIAVPTIAGNLGVSPSQGTWVITSYSVSLGIVLPLTGWLSRRFGEVRLFVVGIFLFTVVSLCCGLANNLPTLLVCRVIQGAFAAPLIPISQNLLLTYYPKDKKGLATVLWAMIAVVAPLFGPILGGWITENFTWPWIFYINIPVGIFSAYVTAVLLRKDAKPSQKIPLDLIGLLLLIIGIGGLQIVCDQGRDMDWFNSSFIMVLSIAACVALSFFVIWEMTSRHGLVDLSLFRYRNFLFGNIALGVGYLLFFGNITLFPFWLQTQMGYTATYAGFASASIALLSFIVLPLVGIMMKKRDLRWFASTSFLFFSFTAFWSSTFHTQLDFFQLILPRIFQGVGAGFFYPPLISIVLSEISAEDSASALGLANFFRMISASIGISLCLTLIEHREKLHYAQLAEVMTPLNPNYLQHIERLQQAGLTSQQGLAEIHLEIVHQAYMLAMNDFFLFSGYVFLVLLGLIWLTKKAMVGE